VLVVEKAKGEAYRSGLDDVALLVEHDVERE
jgi:hypothetical protein